MFRSFFVFLSKATWARRAVMNWGLARLMSSRFVAGEDIEDAVRAIQALNAKGINATLDHLGEHTTKPDEARQATQDILDALDAIQASNIRANVSIKLTQIGLNLDVKLCLDNLTRILEYARGLNNFVRIDMEDSTVTEITLNVLRQVRKAGFDNVGAVIQSYLMRSEEDTRQLLREGVAVRLCKGAYKEPPTVAYPRKGDVDAAFDRLTDILLTGVGENGFPTISADGRFPPLPALATHDVRRITYACEAVERLDLPKLAVEFQMLHGIRRDLQEDLAAEGYPVRVYVPYGTEWYPYFMRRLGERPANVWFIVSNLLRR